MRLHHLTLTAFGPFPDTVEVDFEELNDAGVFLVTGPTGSGKTSLLDAVCFALYGVVPGVRDVKTLRSHHAPPQARPEVVLEVSIGDRRFRITRSPEWLRPKKRGAGTTREHARATLVELTEGTEQLLSSRAQEVGHELMLLLGMSSEQFMQVVLLPQGEFQRFLRASSDQRQEVLQRLFSTQRFVEIEGWVQERSRELGRTAEQCGRRVAQLIATLAHRCGSELPEALSSDPLGEVADLARGWAAETVAAVEGTARDAGRHESASRQALEAAEVVAAVASRRATAVARRTTALARLDELADTEAEAQAAAERLRRHASALPVRPHLEPVASLEAAHEAASRSVTAASDRALRSPAVLAALGSSIDAGGSPTWGSSCSECRSTRDALVERLAELRAATPRERVAGEAAEQLAAASSQLMAVAAEIAELEDRAELLPSQITEAEVRLQRLRVSLAHEAAAVADETRAAARHQAAAAVPQAAERHAALLDRWRDARDREADARLHHLGLLERRLAGIAAELAGQLVDGEPCQVCGGREHPSPAAATSEAVTQQQQSRAEKAAAVAAEAAEELRQQVQESTQRLAELEQRADGDLHEAAESLRAARVALAEARAAAAALPAAEQERLALQGELDGFAARRAQLHRSQASLTAEAAAAAERLAEARADLARVGGAAEPDGHEGALTRLVDQHETGLSLVERLLDCIEERDRLAERLVEALTRADKVAAEQGFSSREEAAAALLPATEATRLEAAAQARQDERRLAEAVLADDELRWLEGLEASGAEVVSPAGAADRLEAARRELRAATADAGRCVEAATAARALLTALEEALAAWEPARRGHATVRGVAELLRGRGADNQLQMRLSSYVLATRLDQVLEAANSRLCEMRDQRYSLRRTGAARGNVRAGLGIEVLDAWTGESRAPATLSGGETFVVSLALALGLADVVSQEAGGSRVDTLFVDEGFGSLDLDTLDDVMDRLDALRAGGRTVGVVSHVSELRTRIPVQLHVARGRQGSSVALRTLTA